MARILISMIMSNVHMEKRTLVIGASVKPDRYSYKACKMLKSHGIPFEVLSNSKAIMDDGTPIYNLDHPPSEFHTITLYVGPPRQPYFYDFIFACNPKRIIFNPGTENPELIKMAEESGVEALEACTLVLLSTNQF